MTAHFTGLLDAMVEHQASDLYLTVGMPPMMRVQDRLVPADDYALKNETLQWMLQQALTPDQWQQFLDHMEYNSAYVWNNERFRLNLLRQQQHVGAVIRRIHTTIPTLESLGVPALFGDMALNARGLIIVAGPTGAGKTSSLAAMVNHRNQHGSGHILTLEDPVEYLHTPARCVLTQRDIGVDTLSFGEGLKQALRQRPDLVVIGEVRDSEVMDLALQSAEAGHLCLATIHARNACQALERIMHLFPEDRVRQVRMHLALNLRAILSQRLIPGTDGKRCLITELLLNRGLITTHILDGNVREIRELIERGTSEGMHSMDQSILRLYREEKISETVALAEAEQTANLQLAITQHKTGAGYARAAARPVSDF